MIWVPNSLHSLELRRNCANLTTSGRPSFAVAWQSPCAPHTGQNTIIIIIIKVDDILTTGQQNGRVLLGAHGEVLTHWTFDPNVFQSRVHQCNALQKMPKVNRGRSLRPPTPCLANFDPENIARAADEIVLETLWLASLLRLYQQLQPGVVPVRVAVG